MCKDGQHWSLDEMVEEATKFWIKTSVITKIEYYIPKQLKTLQMPMHNMFKKGCWVKVAFATAAIHMN